MDRAIFSNRTVNVTQKNGHPSRDSKYINAAFTPSNAADLTRDMGFNGAIRQRERPAALLEGGPNECDRRALASVFKIMFMSLHADTGTPLMNTDIGPAATLRFSVRERKPG